MASLDNIFVMVEVFMIAIVLVVGVLMWDNINVDSIFDHSDTTRHIRANTGSFYSSLDTVYVIAFFVLHLGVLILAFALRSHPIIYVASFILVILLAVISVPLSNAYETFESEGVILSSSAQLPMTSFLMGRLPMIEVVFGFLTAIVLAGLARSEGII